MQEMTISRPDANFADRPTSAAIGANPDSGRDARQAPQTRGKLSPNRMSPDEIVLALKNPGGHESNDNQEASSSEFHPLVYWVMIGLAIWFAGSAWAFGGDGGADYVLVVVTGFMGIVVALSWILLRVWRGAHRADAATERREYFPDWASRGFETGSGPLKGGQAVIQALLPLAAVAFGMTAFAVVIRLFARAN